MTHQKEKILLILPYFGKKFPSYFQHYLDSVGRSEILDLLLITDIDISRYTIPKNTKVISQPFKKFVREIAQKIEPVIGRTIKLSRPYKLCDYKPVYGFLFEEEIKAYSHWAFGDCDVIYGDIDRLLSDFASYDFLGHMGHLGIIRNTDELRQLWKKFGFYRNQIAEEENRWLDEHFFIPYLFSLKHIRSKRINYLIACIVSYIPDKSFHKYPLMPPFLLAYISQKKFVTRNQVRKKQRLKDQSFVAFEGALYGIINKEIDREYLYIHFHKRHMKNETQNTDFVVIPNKFQPITVQEKHLVQNYAPSHSDTSDEGEKTLELVPKFSKAETHKYVFLGGMHRSGTSILHKVLADQADISGFHEIGFPQDEGQFLIQDILPCDEDCGGFLRVGYSRQARMTESSSLAKEEVKQKILHRWNAHWDTQKAFLIEKTPTLNLLRMRFWQKLFPQAYFVVITRHPIAYSYGVLNLKRHKKITLPNIVKSLEHWSHCQKIFAKDQKHIRNLKMFRYEDFVMTPKKHLEDIFAFIQNPDVPTLTRNIQSDTNKKYFELWKEEIKHNSLEMSELKARLEKQINRWGYSFNLDAPYLEREDPRYVFQIERQKSKKKRIFDLEMSQKKVASASSKNPQKIEPKNIFIHIPKTAGMSIRSMLEEDIFIGKHLPPETRLFDSGVEVEGKFIFAVVRNPWDRLVSAYFFLSDNNDPKPVMKEASKRVKQYASFSEFVRGLQTDPKLQDIVHLKPQCYWMEGEKKRNLDFIIRFEHLETDIKALQKILGGAPQNIPQKNQSQHRKYAEYYDQETREIVRQIYREDIQRFGYAFNGGPSNIVDGILMEKIIPSSAL